MHSSSCLFSLGARRRVKKQQATREIRRGLLYELRPVGPAEGRAVYRNNADKQPLCRPSVLRFKPAVLLTLESAKTPRNTLGAGLPSMSADTPLSQHRYLHNSLSSAYWVCVHIRCCGHGHLGFRPDGGSLSKSAKLPSPVGAGLPAMTVYQSINLLADLPPSQASQLPQGAAHAWTIRSAVRPPRFACDFDLRRPVKPRWP